MLVGSRVVRGPDWKFEEEEDQDGGEGFVGTITSIHKFKDGSPLPKGTVLVYWDTGYQGCYRAGQDGCQDLRILDSAPAGIKFSSYSCYGCKQAVIAGMRWQCAVCPNYNLCTLCYMNDIHDRNHRFVRFDVSNDSTNVIDVGQRSTSSKIQAKGMFPAAIVKTGHDWTSESLGNGIVLELASWEHIPRSAVKVDWDNFCELFLRLGHEGKVDLELVTSSLGPFYYKDHLPTVSLDDMNSLKKLSSFSSEKQGQQNVESTVQSNENADLKGELQHELIQGLQTCQQSDNTTSDSIKPPPRPPRTLPKPSPRSPRNNNSTNSNIVEQSEARQEQPTTAPTNKVKDLVKRMSQANMGDMGGRTSVKPKAPAPPKPANKVNPSDTTLKPSKKTRPAPPPPRPHSTIFAGSDNISPELKTKDNKAAPSRMRVASLAANLDNLLQLDPTKGQMQNRKPPARDLICMSCDEKASKVVFEPCGHLVDVVCLGCARKLKRCFKCNEAINKKTTPDGSQLPEPDDEKDTSNNEKMKDLERQLEEAKREVECPICMDERCQVLFGCGHRTCMDCSDLIGQGNNQCPICKQNITERKRMF